jgi:hypothetical protein
MFVEGWCVEEVFWWGLLCIDFPESWKLFGPKIKKQKMKRNFAEVRAEVSLLWQDE